LNDATLHMPLDDLRLGADAVSAGLPSLLTALLQRDPTRRLGAAGSDAIRQHPFFDDVEWELLAQGLLPAPFVPDPQLVYAKDIVPPLSEDERAKENLGRAEAMPPPAAKDGAAGPVAAEPDEATLDIENWDYCANQATFARELRAFVRKAPDHFWDRWW
jgi:hypothetical protein